MSDQELKLALAKMLPEKVHVVEFLDEKEPYHRFYWFNKTVTGGTEIQDTEMLHVCHLIEKDLNNHAWWSFVAYLSDICGAGFSLGISATWQQRAEALIKIKGVK